MADDPPITKELLLSLGLRFHGQVYKYWICQMSHGTQQVRRYVIPPDPKTLPQLVLRSQWAAGIKAWQNLSESDKLYWRRVGVRKKKPITSLNAFLSWWMRFGPWKPTQMGAVLRSIQVFYFDTPGFKPISPVVTSKTILICSFLHAYEPSEYAHEAYAYLWSPNWLYVGLTSAHAIVHVLEFHAGISNVQRGLINLPIGQLTAEILISAVNPQRTVIINTGFKFIYFALPKYTPTVALLNSTTLRAARLAPAPSTNAYYETLEFT